MSIAAEPATPGVNQAAIDRGYAECAATARRAASNFYLTFWLLPREKRLATCALYAFFRRADDAADSPAPADERRRALAAYRRDLTAALAGDGADLQLAALADAIRRYAIPQQYFYDALDGVALDIADRRPSDNDECTPMFQKVAELEGYCYRVASVVGLACIHVWGFRDPAALALAVQCGYAFQWTNILRDLGEDRRQARIYLPAETLREHGCGSGDLAKVASLSINPTATSNDRQVMQSRDRVAALLQTEISRAHGYYAAAEPLLPLLSSDGRRIFAAMFTTYRELLSRVERASIGVFATRVRVPTWRKLQIAAVSLIAGRTLMGSRNLTHSSSESSGR